MCMFLVMPVKEKNKPQERQRLCRSPVWKDSPKYKSSYCKVHYAKAVKLLEHYVDDRKDGLDYDQGKKNTKALLEDNKINRSFFHVI